MSYKVGFDSFPEGAEERLISLGSEWEWLENGDLRTITATVPAVKAFKGPEASIRKAFFNSIIAGNNLTGVNVLLIFCSLAYKGWNDSRNRGDKAVVLANGTFLSVEWIEHAAMVMDEISVSLPWKKGDVLLLNNNVVM